MHSPCRYADSIQIQILLLLFPHTLTFTHAHAHTHAHQDRLLELMWHKMGLVRVYTKPRGRAPDFSEPVVLTAWRHGVTVEAFCQHIHKDLLERFSYAQVWGISTKHMPQRCGRAHVLMDEDVVQIVTTTNTQQRRGKDYAQQCQDAHDKWKEKKKKPKLKT